MVNLDNQEKLALKEFQKTLEPKPKINLELISRGAEGQIIVPLTLQRDSLSCSLALLMEQKADHIYKQTACRIVLAQSLEKDPQKRKYVWIENSWEPIP